MTSASDKKINAAKRIADCLAEDIAAGILESGQRLDEMSLAKRFGLSRTPIREALTLLTGQSILTTSSGRGTFVSKYSPIELSQMFEAMQMIEELCTNLAAKRLTLLAQADISSPSKTPVRKLRETAISVPFVAPTRPFTNQSTRPCKTPS